MLCRSDIRKIIVASVEDLSPSGAEAIDGSTDLTELGIDSLEFTSLVIEIEDQLPEPLPADALDRLADLERYTLDAVLDLLTQAMGIRSCTCDACQASRA